MPPRVEKIITHLWQVDEGNHIHLYAILDAARDEALYPQLMAAGIEGASLFRGAKAREMALVAPYLVRFGQSDPLLRWVINNGWGHSWGIFIQSPADFAALKRHMRSLLQVFDEDGNSLFFRYYDPRVLRVYLPTCNPQELEIFFGPVTCFCLADEDAETLLRFRRTADGLQTDKNFLAFVHDDRR